MRADTLPHSIRPLPTLKLDRPDLVSVLGAKTELHTVLFIEKVADIQTHARTRLLTPFQATQIENTQYGYFGECVSLDNQCLFSTFTTTDNSTV